MNIKSYKNYRKEDFMFLSLLMQIFPNIMYFFLHATSQGSFPKALTQEQESELILKMESGDEDAKFKLIEHNLRLVAHVAKKYYASTADQDDLISIGTIGLIKAISSFNSQKGIRLATYAARCIENATLSQMSFWLRKELPTGELPNRLQKICI
jgi:RNA polymerase sporulation-specific sigma factor